MRKAATPFFLVLGLLAAVVSGAGQTVRAADTETAAAPPTFSPKEYRLGPGDKLRVTVFGEDNLSGQFTVGTSGRLAMPLIGEVNAQGVTAAELEKAIDTKLRDGYLRDPKVSLEVMAYRPFYILGEVNRPGEYPYTDDLTVVKAVATANGFTYRANKKRVFIKHAGETVEKAYPAESTTTVAPGDTIRVAERFF